MYVTGHAITFLPAPSKLYIIHLLRPEANSSGCSSGVFRGALCEGSPFGRTAVIFVTILGLFLALFTDKIAATRDQMRFLDKNAIKCVCGRGSAPDPAGGAYSAPPALPTCLLLTHVA